MFQFAEQDRFITPGLAKIYWEAAREPKLQKWYYTSHEFNDPMAQVTVTSFWKRN